MKVLGMAGSPRKGGNTDTLLARFMEGAAEQRGGSQNPFSLQSEDCRLLALRCLPGKRHLPGQG